MNETTNSTDRELFRENADSPHAYYEPSVHVTEGGLIGMSVAGTVYVKSIAEWHQLAGGAEHWAPVTPGDTWRVGNHCPRNLYSGSTDVGRMDTPELAAHVVDTMNRRLEAPAELARQTQRMKILRDALYAILLNPNSSAASRTRAHQAINAEIEVQEGRRLSHAGSGHGE